MASLGPTLNLRPNGASPRCLTVIITDTSSSSKSVSNNISNNPFDSDRHSNNPFGDDDDDEDDDDDGRGFGVRKGSGGYVYSVTFGTDHGSLHHRTYSLSSTSLSTLTSSSRYDSGGSSVVSSNRGGNVRGGDQTMTDPSRLDIEPIKSDSIDLRGTMKGSIVSIIRYDTLPIFLALVDDNNSHRSGNGSGGGGVGTPKDSGAYAAHLATVRNGTFHEIDNAGNGLSTATTGGMMLPRMTCAAYHPDAGYVYASGTGVYGLSTTGITTAISSSSPPPTALYLGCARCLPPPGARTSSSGGHQNNMTLCCSGRVAIVAVANAFYSVPCYLTLSRGGVTNNVQSVTAIKIASFAQSSQVHPVMIVEILADANSLSTRASYSTPDENLMRPITSLVFLASGRECSTVEITSVPNGNSSNSIGGEGIIPTAVQLTSRSQKKHGSYTASLPSPILAVASVPPIAAARGESSTRGSSVGRRGGDLSSGPLIVLLTVDGLVHLRSPSCIAVALTSVEVGTRPNDFFTLSLLPLPHTSLRGKRAVVATSYGGESRLVTVDDRESKQDFADRLMRLCIDAFGPHGFPRLELAEASGATFSATSYTGSGGGGGGEQESSSSSTAALSHKRALLKQYLESVLGLADDARARSSSSSSPPQRTPVLLQVGDDMVEAVDILSLDEQDEESNVATISILGANSLLTCTTLLCLVCYQLSSPDGVTAIRSSKACASAMGISSSSTFSKAAVAVCEIVADRLLREMTSSSMASISLLTTSSLSPIVSSYASSTNFVMEFIESAIWLLRACGSHEKAINALQTRLDSPAFRNSMGGGGGKGTTNCAGAAGGGWSQIKFDSYIATHLGELWSSNDDRYRRIVLMSSATRDLIQREPTLGLSVFTMMNPRNENEWRQMKPEDDPLIHPTYPPKIVELLRSITPHQSIGTGGSSDEHNQLFSSFSDGSPKASSPLPMNSGRALAVSYLESAIGIDTGRPSFPDTSRSFDLSNDEIDERKADMHDELYYLLLEGVISERGDDKGEDTKLGAMYRVKLWRLLRWVNSQIRSDKLLSSVPSSFLHERALLLGRLGRHEDALRILYSQEKGLDLALEYCDVRHKRYVARMKDIKDVGGGVGSSMALHHECSYTPLVKVALSTDPDPDRGIAAAIQVLALRRGVINKAAALRLMPKNLPMSSIARPFLIPAMVENESEVRRLTMASSLLRSRYIQLKQKLTDAQLKSQASLHSTPALQRMNLGEPLHSSKPTRARLVHAPSTYSLDVTLIKHFFSRHMVIQARVNNSAPVPLTNVTFVVAESSDDALVPTMEIPLKTVPPEAVGSAWCVLSVSPQRLDGAAFLTCELRYTVLEMNAATGIPTSFSEGTNPGPGNGRISVEELHDIEVRHTEFQ